MEEQLEINEWDYETNEWNREPDCEPIAGGRIRVVRDGLKIRWFRRGVEARLPVRNLQNVGACAFVVAAMKGEWANNSVKILKGTKLRPGERLSTFVPLPQTMYLTIIHTDDGCSAPIILECDDTLRG